MIREFEYILLPIYLILYTPTMDIGKPTQEMDTRSDADWAYALFSIYV